MGSNETGFLILDREAGERIFIGEDICVSIKKIFKRKVLLGISAPKNVRIMREEVMLRDMQNGNQNWRYDNGNQK